MRTRTQSRLWQTLAATLLLALLALPATALAHAFLATTVTEEWHTFAGGSNSDVARDMVRDSSGNLFLVGFSASSWGSPINPHSGSNDITVVKYDRDGNYQWHTFLGGTSSDNGYGIALDDSGNIYITGYSDGAWGTPINAYTDDADIVVIKLNSAGVYQWHTFFGSSDLDESYDIALDDSGNIFIAARSGSTWGTPINPHAGGGTLDLEVIKLNSAGVYQWHTFFGSGDPDTANALALDNSGNVYLAGASFSTWGAPLNAFPSGTFAMVVVKLNNAGVYQWHTFVGGDSANSASAITLDSSGNIYLAGNGFLAWGSPLAPHSSGDNGDIQVVKLDSAGAYQWHTYAGGTGNEGAYGIELDTDGSIYTAAHASASWGAPLNAFAGGLGDMAVLKLDSSGAYQWHTFAGDTGLEVSYDLALDGLGGIYLAGSGGAAWAGALNPFVDINDVLLVKLSEGEAAAEPEADNPSVSTAIAATGTTTLDLGRIIVSVPASAVAGLGDACRLGIEEVGGSDQFGVSLGDTVWDVDIVCGETNQHIFFAPLTICIRPLDGSTGDKQVFHRHPGDSDFSALTRTDDLSGYVCGQTRVLSLFTLGDFSLPATGFAPGVTADLGAEIAYAATDLTLDIPALDVHLPIVGVPQSANGWDVSWLGDSAGYLQGTAFPTLVGNTVLTAHVWGADNQPGPFIGLEDLHYGDHFSITAWGSTYTYEVRSNQLYDPGSLAPLTHEDYDWVTLLTCADFDAASGSYTYRRAVRAVLVSVD